MKNALRTRRHEERYVKNLLQEGVNYPPPIALFD